jgi:hypothetical protein
MTSVPGKKRKFPPENTISAKIDEDTCVLIEGNGREEIMVCLEGDEYKVYKLGKFLAPSE